MTDKTGQMLVHRAHQGSEGIGVRVNRLFPVAGKMHHDPFVLWDDFAVPPSAGFPDHPHRGFEAITYVMQGSMSHTDNLGNRSTVLAGGLQRFTAGSGIVHSEMPSATETTRGIQLWINLPSKLKQIAPHYQQVNSDEVPEHALPDGVLRVLVGEGSPLRLHTAVQYLDLQLQAGGDYHCSAPGEYRGLIYLFAGAVQLTGATAQVNLQATESALFEHGGDILVHAQHNSRLLLCFGRPHNEPIHQHGTFVD